MKRTLFGLVAALGLMAGSAFAATYVSGALRVSSLVGAFSLPINTPGPQAAVLPLNGGTLTCAGGALAVANTAVDAGSLIVLTLKTAGGTQAAPYLSGITAGTGFTVTCGGSDTSQYNYLILG